MIKNKQAMNFILATLIFIIGLTISIPLFNIHHENVHVAILKSYGIESQAVMTPFTGTTYASQNQPEQARELNDMAEIIGYHVFALMISIWIFAYLIMLYFIIKK